MLKKVPHTYVIIFFLIVLSAVLTWVIPGGSFERQTALVNGVEREVIKPGSFQFTESNAQTWQVFSSFFDGITSTANIIAFILIIGGAFWILNESKSIDIGIYAFLNRSKKWERSKLLRKIGVNNILLVAIMFVFSLFGAVFGMSEETIAFTVIFVPLAVSMGYDSIVGVSLCFIAATIGFAGAFLNPFTVGIAQGLSNIPLFSGIEYRIFMWIVLNIVGFSYILRYAKKIKRSPKLSPVFIEDAYWRKRSSESNLDFEYFVPKSAWFSFVLLTVALAVFSVFFPFSTLYIGSLKITFPAVPVLSTVFVVSGIISLQKTVHYYILVLLTFAILFLVTGVMGYGWYISKIATLFLALGIAAGIAANQSPNQITKSFLAGAKDILPAALVVGLARGIIVILENGNIIDTILFTVSSSMQDLGKVGSVAVMYLIQTGLNIFVPSGSGQAALTIPIMSQISDLIEVSRQATVVVFQLGDGFTNMITPTSGVLIAVLGVARIPYEKWFIWAWKFILMLFLLGFVLLLPTVLMDLNGF